jgi:23S rRNA pseudouridine1911/1915/1917 synthase
LQLDLTPVDPPQRCDQALVEALAQAGHELSRSQLSRTFAAGKVTAQGRVLRPARRIDAPLTVTVELEPAAPMRAQPQAIALVVLHEDDDLLVVDKPAGMVVHPSAGHPDGTLVNAVLHHLGVEAEALPVLPGNDGTRPGIVHRLDRDTSGVLVVAKHARAQTHLAAQFAAHDLDRRYTAVLAGVPTWTTQHVATGHGRDPTERRRFAPVPGATRRARSDFSILETLVGAVVAQVRLHTGRTHQIRMHARHLGHPVLADALYGPARPSTDPRRRAAEAAIGRQALHAGLLALRHPTGDHLVSWTSPLPSDIEALIAALR